MRFGVLLMMGALAACNADESTSDGVDGTGGAEPEPACAADLDGETLHFAIESELESGADETLCLRWTTDEALDITGFVGDLGSTGHHSIMLVHESPTEPDGIAPCYEPDLMDSATVGDFAMLAGVSYESSGFEYTFPSSPVQVGLHVPAGSQLIFDAHMLNTSSTPTKNCSTLDLHRGAPVVAKLEFVTVLPEEQYNLSIPAMGSTNVTYEQVVGERVRVAAASSHMHEGGTHFRMSIKETDETLFETTSWSEPNPAVYDTTKLVLEADQTFVLECSFDNTTTRTVRFPEQMCVGGLYVLPCTLPGAC